VLIGVASDVPREIDGRWVRVGMTLGNTNLVTLSSLLNPGRTFSSRLQSVQMAVHFSAEDSLNIGMREITVTARDGRVSQLEQVYIRGSMVSVNPLFLIERRRWRR
jgi:hypothetical protein